MALDADIILDRIRLKKKAKKWQAIAVAVIIFSIFMVAGKFTGLDKVGGYVAEIEINDMIFDDTHRIEIIQNLYEDKKLRALIVNINSPGGTIAGSEALYRNIKRISNELPVIAVVKDYAASGGYLVALAADKIYASNGSVVGSIGVLAQNFEVTELAKSWGIKLDINKTSKFKANPSPFEKVDPAALKAQSEMLDDFLSYFKDIVQTERSLSNSQMQQVADGRVFTGRQGLSLNLVDDIGDSFEAAKWLEEKYQIKSKIVKVSLQKEPNIFNNIGSSIVNSIMGSENSIFSKKIRNKYLAVMPNSL